MYVSSSKPIDANSTTPPTRRLLRSQARATRTGLIMARGRLSNLQCQPDLPRTVGPGVDYPSVPMGSMPVPSASLVPPANTAPAVPSMPSTLAVASATSSSPATLVNTNPPPSVLGRPKRAAIPMRRVSGNLSAAERQYVAEAPQMVVGDVAKLTCSAGDEDKRVETSPRSAPPWANALVVSSRGGTGTTFSLGNWIAAHPWLALLLLGVAGAAMQSSSRR